MILWYLKNPKRPGNPSGPDRSYRNIRMLAFIPGIILLLISGVFTKAGTFNLIAVAPLTLSALLGLVSVAGKDKRMPWTMYADLCIAMFFVSVLVPLYVRLGVRLTNVFRLTDDLQLSQMDHLGSLYEFMERV